MIHTAPAFIRDARVWTVISGEPIVSGMAGRAIRPKHACMEDRVVITTHTC